MRTSIALEESYLHATLSGAFSLNEAKDSFCQILDTVAKHDTQRILIDGSGLAGSPLPVERYLYGIFVFEEVDRCVKLGRLNVAPRFAYILLPPLRDTGKFGENIASSRGLDVQVFERLDEALQWLLGEGDR